MAAQQTQADPETMRLSYAATALDGQFTGVDVPFTGGTTDSRNIAPGEMFIALRGARVDGHDFLATARARGAVAALVEHAVDDPLPQLRVADAKVGLGKLAALWRVQYRCPLIGLTGSNGKTTVKELLAAILSRRGATLATQGNLNNDIGMPLTLLRLRRAHEYAVIEMGANHPGEIAALTILARPDVALITNAGPAHLEGFGSIEGVAHAKGEIFSGLSPDGVAVINADDQYAAVWETAAAGRRILRFGLSERADVRGEWQGDAAGSRIHLQTPAGEARATLHLPGQHNVMNALAATAAALAVGASLADITAGLEAAHGAPGRMQSKSGRNGARVIDDTYNANPASVQAALEVLANCRGKRIFVLGDLAELGDDTVELHRSIGAAVADAGIDALYSVGALSVHAANAFSGEHRHFATRDELIAHVTSLLAAQVTVLVKGSRSARMEEVVNAIVGSMPDAAH